MPFTRSGAVSLAVCLSLAASSPLGAQCPGPPAGQQEAEPNGSPAQATPIALWTFEGHFVGVRGAIDSPGDVDYYRFDVTTAGTRVWLVVDTGGGQTAGSSRDSVVTLLAPDGSTVLEEDDDDGTGTGRDTVIESLDASAIGALQLPAAGSYYVRVRAKNPADVISHYVLALGVTTSAPNPESEPNDDPAQAQFAWGIVEGSLSSATDVDWYLIGVLDDGIPMVVVDGDPERDGIVTDVTLRYEGFTGTLQTDSSIGTGQPPPGAEGFMIDSVGARLRITGTGPGSYRLLALMSGESCPVPAELQSFTIR